MASDLADEFLGVTAAKTELPGRIKRMQSGQLGRIVLLRQNNPVAVIVTPEEYNRFQHLDAASEWVEDALAVLQAKKADDGTRVTLDELKAQFRLD